MDQKQMQASGVVATLELKVRSDVWGGPPSGVQGRVLGRGSCPLPKPKAFLFLDIPRGHILPHLKIS